MQKGALAGLLGCIFGVLGIFAIGLIFVPLAVLCALVGLFRGIAGNSVAGIGTSLLAGALSVIGFMVSPSLWLTSGLVGLSLLTLPHLSGTRPASPVPSQTPYPTHVVAPVPPRLPSTICLHEDYSTIVFQRTFIRIGDGNAAGFYNAVVSGHIAQNGNVRFIKDVSFTFFDTEPGCQIAYDIALHGASGRIETATLGSTAIASLIAVSFGGSGDGYSNVLVGKTINGLVSISPSNLDHSNMGGFFVGDVGGEYGEGILVWDAIWNSPGHYSPHTYSVRFYRWSGTQFLAPKEFATTQYLPPEPGSLPKFLGLSVTDQTGQGEFGRVQP